MNVKNLQARYPVLITHMKAVGYSDGYIQQIYHEIRLIIEEPNRWASYEEIVENHEEIIHGKEKHGRLKAIINLIAKFDVYGILPRTGDDRSYFHQGSYYQLNDEFKGLIDYYHSNANRNTKKETTIYNECHNTSSFLLRLQNNGYNSLEEITEDAILSLLTDDSGYPVRSSSYADYIIAVFRGAFEWNPECQRILLYIPSIRRRRKNIQYLEPDERAKIKSALKDNSNTLSDRNRAIGCLFYFTGLRCCDISNLSFADIDWDKDEISIVQQKTDVILKLPMTAVVGNAIYDYITQERKASDESYVFLSCNYPYGKLKPASVGMLTDKIYKNAEIRQNHGERRGGHLFRHNFATSMLENGVSMAVISRAMGHTSPDATEVYLSADMVHLKEYALSIEAFPVREGAFHSERI